MKNQKASQIPLFVDKAVPELLPCQLCGRQVLYVVLASAKTYFVHSQNDFCTLYHLGGEINGKS